MHWVACPRCRHVGPPAARSLARSLATARSGLSGARYHPAQARAMDPNDTRPKRFLVAPVTWGNLANRLLGAYTCTHVCVAAASGGRLAAWPPAPFRMPLPARGRSAPHNRRDHTCDPRRDPLAPRARADRRVLADVLPRVGAGTMVPQGTGRRCPSPDGVRHARRVCCLVRRGRRCHAATCPRCAARHVARRMLCDTWRALCCGGFNGPSGRSVCSCSFST
jgi:hypothetical protein